MVNFGQLLKELRQQAGLTQKQLGERLWISKATVSYYEQSLRYPSPEILVKIANVFHVSTDYLLGRESKAQTLDVTDLTDEDIALLNSMIEHLRRKNINKN
ncbi:MAG: helix-turn-helix transcriptional regulator [Ruminiclostridium sp.]|nr:helix-turn-helix transcriptional regulator [Ruminiclostridium sp.]MBQ8842713.1 helix-turn-helix transcriptional regulator [Ruminiclostridium sp.]